MQTVSTFPRAVREIENVFIPLSDGCRLAARIWLPEDAERDPVPAILEYLPYRKRDGTAERDHLTHPYTAGHGYACIRVDLRGSGESDGLLFDEYSQQEHDDALEVLAWIARQPWSTGKVGMIGISWGGFNGLQIAARRPPELAAVVTLCSTDDRYADDIHAMGGCVLNDKLGWASTMFAIMTRPPDPALVGERWRDMWMERLENEPLFIETWLRHQRRDDFFRHGSVCEDYGAIQCPVYAVGGWADGYSNAIPRLLAGLKVPRKGLIGPWAHKYPHFATPGPRIGFLQECLRWWDQWLKGRTTGVMDEPMLRAWVQDWVPPRTQYDERPGRWVAEPSWPSPHVVAETLALTAGGSLSPRTPSSVIPAKAGTHGSAGTGGDMGPGFRRDDDHGVLSIHSPQNTGLGSGRWCPYGAPADMPTDQREDDGKSLVFDGAPLAEPIEILGAPVVELDLASDRPNALVAVRLNDVAPDGSSLRVTYGLLNLTHRDGHAEPQPLEPGRRYRVRVQLNDIGHRFRAGHRIRVAISSAYWPIAWPSPEPVTLSVRPAASSLTLPVRRPRPEDDALPPFPPAEASPAQKKTWLREGATTATWSRDLVTGETVHERIDDEGHTRLDLHGLEHDAVKRSVMRIGEDDPNSAVVTKSYTIRMGRGDWRIRTETTTTMRSTPTEFLLEAGLEAFEGEERVVHRTWKTAILRDLV